ncbi:Thiamin pyrophosphokinase 1 [Anthophora retusa]
MCNIRRTILKLSFIVNRVQQLLLLKKYKLNLIMQRDGDLNRTIWDPLQIFNCDKHYKYAVVILNSPLNWKNDSLLQIWKKAQINVTVDGGTYRWLRYLEEQGIDLLSGNHSEYVPHLITGDMDSCPSLILENLKRLGSMIIETPDQDHTDYTKALFQLGQYAKKENINLNAIYVFVDSSGRFDHIMGNINTLYKSDKLIGHIQVIQIASSSLTWILRPGLHHIVIPKILVQNNTWCGLLPIGAPVNSIVTTGLKWNLNNAALQFGALVSSSNTYDNCSEVTVNTDSPVVWTMGVEPLQKI